MSGSRLGIVGIALVALLAFPRASSANVVDVIFGMSGPQLIGPVLLHCKIYFGPNAPPPCHDIRYELINLKRRVHIDVTPFGFPKPRLAFEAIFFTSTGTNSENNDDYKGFRAYMVALEPMLEVGSFTAGNAKVYHGLLGLSLDALFGDFDTFGKVGLKFRPVGVTFPVGGGLTADISLNLRFYPDGFTRQDFGFTPQPGDKPHGRERVWGLAGGLAW